MTSLLNADDAQPTTFWRRQFSFERTTHQVIFDAVFGIAFPIVCFYYDPGFIRGEFASSLPKLSIFIYGVSALQIIAMVVWLTVGHRSTVASMLLSGCFLSGATLSISIGIAILPFTLIGIFFLIGLLGFVPFLTGFVYLRNGVRALHRGFAGTDRLLRAGAVVFALLVLGFPAALQWQVSLIFNSSMNEILASDSSDDAIRRMKLIKPFVESDNIALRYAQESDSDRRRRLARAYREITGRDLEERISILED
jgi:hypothetical protein